MKKQRIELSEALTPEELFYRLQRMNGEIVSVCKTRDYTNLAARYIIITEKEVNEDSEIINQDIIDFRHKLINWAIGEHYFVCGLVCNDGYTNVMTEERKKVLNDLLVQFNIHFDGKGYDLG